MQNAKAKGKRVGRPQTTKDDIPAVFYKHYPAFAAGNMNVSELEKGYTPAAKENINPLHVLI